MLERLQPLAHVDSGNGRAAEGEPLRGGIEARAPATISGQQQHQVAHSTWRLKQAQLRKTPPRE